MTLIIDMRSPEERRAAAMADTEEARTRAARLRQLETHKTATAGVLEGLELDLKRRRDPLEKRLDELKAASSTLDMLIGETMDAITALENEMAPAINAAEADANAADTAHWEETRAGR